MLPDVFLYFIHRFAPLHKRGSKASVFIPRIMLDNIINFSIKNKPVIGFLTLALIAWGIYSMTRIPLDAVPDITSNQVQVVTQAPDLATQEVEQFITYPLEVSMSFLPEVIETRSISRFGLSVITIVFEENVDPYHARQLVSEQIRSARENIPEGYGIPHLAPLVTGLSEIYQYTLVVSGEADTTYTPMQLRTIQDWIVKRQLAGIPGVAEVSSFGGYLKQYEVAIAPDRLQANNVSLTDVYEALEKNNRNTGGSYIEKTNTYYFIRGTGMVTSLEDLGKIAVENRNGIPVLISDVAETRFGFAPRFGAMTRNGEGEAVGGLVLMRKGENSNEVTKAIKARVADIQSSLPEGVRIEPFIDRSELIGRAIDTVTMNLVKGGLIVVFILVLLLGTLRAGLVVASVIPLSLLFALGMMNIFGVSANLMSLGAIDFGLVVDGAVIIVETIVLHLHNFGDQRFTARQMDNQVGKAAVRIRRSAAFGEIIILIVYLPVLALSGIEGKMFGPMAKTVSFAIIGALTLSLTYVPMMAALCLKKKITGKKNISDHIMGFFHRLYRPAILFALRAKILVIGFTLLCFFISLFIFSRLGGEFIPTLNEGDIVSHQIMPTGTSLEKMITTSTKIETALLHEFPEVKQVVTRIGTSEIPTDPMPVELGDIIIAMKDQDEWVSASTREEMVEKMEAVINTIPGVGTAFTQPIQMRFNELMTGVRQDIAIKIYGEDLDILSQKALEANDIIHRVEGIGGTVVEQITGLPQIRVKYKREKLAQYNLNVADLNRAVNTAFAGGHAGVVFEGEKRFDLVVRFAEAYRKDINHVRDLFIPVPGGGRVPLRELAEISLRDAPVQISRDNAQRRIVIGANTHTRDTESIVEDIRQQLDEQLVLPPGYHIAYGGQFENLIQARQRLSIAVPAALLLIFLLLYFTFRSAAQAALIFTAVPMAAIGGIFALFIRDMPFSISAGVGFIALFGVAVLNGIVMIAQFNDLKKEGIINIRERILQGTRIRLRPVIMTASVASFGFLPMAISSSAGAEVQRPLATVVIGGLITATLLTLIVLPVLYYYLEKGRPGRRIKGPLLFLLLFTGLLPCHGQQKDSPEDHTLTLQQALQIALKNYPAVQKASLEVKKQQALKKTAFDPGLTSVFYQKEETNGETITGVQSWGIQQDFDFPLTSLKKSQYLQEKVALSQARANLTRNEVAAKVTMAYQNLLLAREKLTAARRLDSVYQNFEHAARLRYETGETGRLESIAAAGKAYKIALELQQAETDWRMAQQSLQNWLNTDKVLLPPPDAPPQLSFTLPAEEGKADNNPVVQYYRQNFEVARAAWKSERSLFWPTLTLGYSDQTVNGQTGFYLYRLGIKVPLFFFSRQGHTRAARLESLMAEKDLREQQLQWKTQMQQADGDLKKATAALQWYQTDGLRLADEQMQAALLSYRLGEIDYVSLIQNLEQAAGIRQEYLGAIGAFNKAVIHWKVLTGTLITN